MHFWQVQSHNAVCNTRHWTAVVIIVALIENYSTSKLLKVSPEKSHILSCDTLVANEQYVNSGPTQQLIKEHFHDMKCKYNCVSPNTVLSEHFTSYFRHHITHYNVSNNTACITYTISPKAKTVYKSKVVSHGKVSQMQQSLQSRHERCKEIKQVLTLHHCEHRSPIPGRGCQ